MSENLTILKSFSRKLANCRFKVPAEDLIAYFKGGQYGYDAVDGEEIVVTNESVFADSIAEAIVHIRGAFKDPHIFLKKEEVIQNVAVASHIDNETLRMNYKDSKLWKLKTLDASPEFVHAFVYEDDLAIYENRFLTYLIDTLFEILTRRVNAMKDTMTTLGDCAGEKKGKGLTRSAFMKLTKESGGTPALVSSNDSKVTIFNSFLKSRKRLTQLKQHPIYVACKKKGEFNILNLHPTNILVVDKQYNYCYDFYLNYLKRESDVTSTEKMYQTFVAMQFLFALDRLGFSAKGQEVFLGQSGQVKLNDVTFKKGAFTVTLSRDRIDEIHCKVVNTVSGSSAEYAVAIYHSSQLSSYTSLTARLDIERMNNPNAFRTVLITDYPSTAEDVIRVLPMRVDATKVLEEVIESFMICVEGATQAYSRVCPLCGGTLVTQVDVDHTCTSCDALYNLYAFEGKEWLWIKRFASVVEDVAEEEEPAPAPAVEEAPLEVQPEAKTEEIPQQPVKKTRLGFFKKKKK